MFYNPFFFSAAILKPSAAHWILSADDPPSPPLMGARRVSCLFNYICIFKVLDVAPELVVVPVRISLVIRVFLVFFFALLFGVFLPSNF